MKKSLYFLIVLLAGLFSACETDFDVTADYKDVTIVYGLLDPGDSVHYVKINKAFLGEGNLLEYASIEDSSTYQNKLDVKLIEMDGDNVVRELSLDTTTIYNKEEGVFYHPRQTVYTTGVNNKIFLNQNYTYKIRIENPATNKIISSETPLIRDFSIIKPALNSLLFPTIHIPNNENDNEISWYSAENGKLYQVVIYFSFYEVDNAGDSTLRTLRWGKFTTSKSNGNDGGELMREQFKNSSFYDFVEANTPYEDQAKEDNVNVRHAEILDFEITVASEDFNTYAEVYKPSSSLNQYTSDYTNIENGLGLFTTRYTKTRSLHPQKATRNLLNMLQVKFANPDL
ncbi:MAG TPA: hypothetical protein VJ939_07465 [Bacteroidales bacterium]|nr:hypothetical protein [Bacteroidales bacterium]